MARYTHNSGDTRGGFNSDKRKDDFSGDRKRSYTFEKGGFKGDNRKDCDPKKGSFKGDRKKSYAPEKGSFKTEKKRDQDIDRSGKRLNDAAGINAQERPGEEELLPNIIMGRNAVKEAIKSGRSIDKILIPETRDGSLNELVGLARDRNLIVREVSRQRLDDICMPFGHSGKTGNHQGIVAFIPGAEYCSIEDMLNYAKERGEAPFIVLLDCIEDPYNLGSIIRSAECAGAHGVIIPKRRAASLNAWAVKASAGAASYMRIARVANISSAIDELKKAGLWIAGADMEGTVAQKVDLKGAIGLVIGNEGDGLSRIVKERCDYLISIPMMGRIDSLNASAAAAVLIFEKRRQDA